MTEARRDQDSQAVIGRAAPKGNMPGAKTAARGFLIRGAEPKARPAALRFRPAQAV